VNCSRCGTSIPDENPACPNCGLPRFAQDHAPHRPQVSYIPPPAPLTEPVRNYLVPSIILTICCCTPFGIIAIIFAAMAASKQSSGDMAGAREAASKARLFCWLAFIIGVISYIVFIAINGAASFFEAFRHTAG
jgi:hypothetical protein